METVTSLLLTAYLTVIGFLGVQPTEPTFGLSVLTVQQGGTGASTFATGECLKGNGTGAITTGSCGTGGGGGGLSTTTPLSDSNLLVYSTSGAGSAYGVATTTVTASSPLSLSNTVWKVGGSNSVLSLDTSGAWTGNAGTATALAADPANCSAGSFPLGITASGAVESCTDAWTEAENTAAGYLSNTYRDWSIISNTFSQSALAPTTTLNIHVSGVGTSTFKGGIEAWRQVSAPYFHGTSTATSTFAGGLNLGTNHITVHGLISDASDGLHIHAGNGTEVGLFGAGNTANALLYGGLNVTGNLAVLTGSTLTITDITSALTLTGAGGIVAEYTGTSCTNQFVRSLSALGVATCESVDAGDFSDADWGDITIATNVASVEDDSHAHTGATLSGVDISADTNLTAGTGITLTGDDLSIDTSQNIATLSNLTGNGAILTSGGVGTLGTYAGSSCTNQFVRSLSGSIAATCATVVATDVDLADLTATNTTLTFSGTYDGQTARTIGLNLANQNTWTALQTFSNSTTTSATFNGGVWMPNISTTSGSILAVEYVSGVKKVVATSTVDVAVFTSSGTWTKPPGAKLVEVVVIAGGGGGGSGRKGALATVRGGGGGGGVGATSKNFFSATLLGTTESITIGAGGTGGAAQSTNSTNGNNGTAGGDSSFGTWLGSTAGTGGTGGLLDEGGAGGVVTTGIVFGQVRENDSANGGPGSYGDGLGASTGGSGLSSGGGGGGGGIDASNVLDTAATGGGGCIYQITGGGPTGPVRYAGGTSGGTTGVGGNGTAADPLLGCGGGGGGGASRNTGGNAYAGGNGGLYGSGGGGGGASTDSVGSSGAGGNGAAGIIIVTTYF